MSTDAAPDPTPVAPRPGAIRVARLLGVPVYVTTSWLVFTVVLIVGYGPLLDRGHGRIQAYLLGLTIVVSLLVTVLLHELGHAVAARHYRVGVRGITLELLGGFTELEDAAPTPGAEAAIALAGPAVSFGLAGVASALLAFADHGSFTSQVLFELAATNLLVGVFNVLPGLPLDGGRALRAAVWRVTRDPLRADMVAGWSGRVIAVGTALAGLWWWRASSVSGAISLIFVALIAGSLWRGASEEIRLVRFKQRLPLINADGMVRQLHRVRSGTPLAEALRQRDEALMLPDGTPMTMRPVVIGVVDSSDRIVGLVNPRAVAAVPEGRRAWVAVDEVTSPVTATQRIAAGSSGEDVLAAVQANPASDLLVTVGEDVVGVLRVADVISMLRSREPTS